MVVAMACSFQAQGFLLPNLLQANPTPLSASEAVVNIFVNYGVSFVLSLSFNQFLKSWKNKNPPNPSVITVNPVLNNGFSNTFNSYSIFPLFENRLNFMI